MDSRSGTPQARPAAGAAAEAAAARLRAGVAGTCFEVVDWVAETGSTNRDLMVGATEADPADPAAPGRRPAVLVTDHQNAGRGTKGRSWFDPPGGSLLLSVRLFPQVAPSRLHLFIMALSVAAADACRAVAGVEVGLKWPNDLFVDDRKLAGVLAESSLRGGRVDALVIGIGMNVNWPVEIPEELGELAVALNHVADHDLDRVELAVALVRGLDRELAGLAAPGGEAVLLRRYRERSATIGRRVRVELPAGPLVGRAVGVDDDGLLVVDVDGVTRTFAAADVTHLRHDAG
jgi:BirA family biotin operon repressor/biotin-[acetyl-CoA-carboxylase] ligase